MKKEEIEKKLETLGIPDVEVPEQHQKELKLAVISAKTSARASLWLLSVPFLILLGALCDSFLHISIPPWSLMKAYGHTWPLWLRMGIFITSVMLFPLTTVLLNVLSIIWLSYDRVQKVLNISIRMKTANLVIIGIAGVLAFLFIGHAIADWIAGHD